MARSRQTGWPGDTLIAPHPVPLPARGEREPSGTDLPTIEVFQSDATALPLPARGERAGVRGFSRLARPRLLQHEIADQLGGAARGVGSRVAHDEGVGLPVEFVQLEFATAGLIGGAETVGHVRGD